MAPLLLAKVFPPRAIVVGKKSKQLTLYGSYDASWEGGQPWGC
jgi:hypothetical protein